MNASPSSAAQVALAYINDVMAKTGLSATALADAASLAPTTLTRFLNDPLHAFSLSLTTLAKIAAATGHPLPSSDLGLSVKLPDPERLAGWIYSVRGTLGFNQIELAQAVGVSQGSISRWENGEHIADYRSVMLIAGLLAASGQTLAEQLSPAESPRSEPESLQSPLARLTDAAAVFEAAARALDPSIADWQLQLERDGIVLVGRRLTALRGGHYLGTPTDGRVEE